MAALIQGSETEYVEILFNDCYGGYGISKEALEKYNTKLDANKGIIITLGVFILGAIFGYIEKLKYIIL